MELTTPPSALLLLAPGCPHCPGVLEGLAALVKEGVIGTLEVVNVAVHPERAAELGVRGVPWTRVGPFELQGALTKTELRDWVQKATTPAGVVEYLERLLAEGGLAKAEAILAHAPEHLAALLKKIADPDLPMQVKLGIGAALEGLAGTAALQRLTSELGELSHHPDHRIRSDACHYLGLTGTSDALPFLEERLSDDNAEVREIATDAIRALQG